MLDWGTVVVDSVVWTAKAFAITALVFVAVIAALVRFTRWGGLVTNCPAIRAEEMCRCVHPCRPPIRCFSSGSPAIIRCMWAD